MNEQRLSLKLFVGCVMADRTGGDTREGCCPFAIMATSIRAAAFEAHEYAATHWPPSGGWVN